MGYRENAPVLGSRVVSFGRTTGQNVAVAGIVVVVLAAAVTLAAFAPSVLAILAIGTALTVVGLILWQILPNWDLRWTLFERGFERSRRGSTERARFEQIVGLYRLPAREARIELDDGRMLKVEALTESVAIADRIEWSVVQERLEGCRDQLAAGDVLVFGPLHVSADRLTIGDQTLHRGTFSLVERGPTTPTTWAFGSGADTVLVPLRDVPFPELVRALLL